jgi:AcrR family transcriptional regulator
VFDMQTDLPPPPWRAGAAPARSRPVRQPLTREGIVDVALGIVDREGIDGLSMRRVAQELDTGPSSLYAHVANKDELLELMVDKVTGEIEIPVPDPARWQEQLKKVVRDTLRRFRAHGDLSRATLATVPTGPNALRVSEGMMAIMISGGLPPRTAGWALDRLVLYVHADAYEGALYGAKVRAAGTDPQAYATQFFGDLRRYLAALPPDRFPMLSAHAESIVSGDGDARFEFGLDVLVDGLAAYVPR